MNTVIRDFIKDTKINSVLISVHFKPILFLMCKYSRLLPWVKLDKFFQFDTAGQILEEIVLAGPTAILTS